MRREPVRCANTSLAVLVGVAMLMVSLGGRAANKADAAKAATDEPAPAKPETVHISVLTVPPRKAQVRWGKKLLGTIPVPRALVVERPRDSGPMDLVIRAGGFLPVHTRAYTFSDSLVAAKLTPPAEKSTIFGYKQEITPVPDAGVPPAAPPPGLTPGPMPAPMPGPTPGPTPSQ